MQLEAGEEVPLLAAELKKNCDGRERIKESRHLVLK
jgi:hypothetical protein